MLACCHDLPCGFFMFSCFFAFQVSPALHAKTKRRKRDRRRKKEFCFRLETFCCFFFLSFLKFSLGWLLLDVLLLFFFPLASVCRLLFLWFSASFPPSSASSTSSSARSLPSPSSSSGLSSCNFLTFSHISLGLTLHRLEHPFFSVCLRICDMMVDDSLARWCKAICFCFFTTTWLLFPRFIFFGVLLFCLLFVLLLFLCLQQGIRCSRNVFF